MKASNLKAQEEVNLEKEHVSKQASTRIGTWISVGVVFAVILVTYFIIYGLYMDRL
ncbi:hypothetical protein [Sutcliffiella cohnii]|uniref:hypothetical protein n=1 Tax=Sutcliffiella cohnii TaxID=33932 RepID=UPI000AF63D87|nr:hypothetical protein [Sutcliffiella cohnii]